MNRRVRALLRASSPLLPPETTIGVEHYLDHDEYEIALEGLLLGLIGRGAVPTDVQPEKIRRLALELRLDRESVLDADFWRKLRSPLPPAE